jgi:putative endonuclease
VARRRGGTLVGREGEAVAAIYLEARGYRLVARNLRFRTGEIDLVMLDGGVLVFVEVKTRTNPEYGSAAEAVTPRKQQQLIRLAKIYLAGLSEERSCRFDVVTVEPDPVAGWICHLIADAFSA